MKRSEAIEIISSRREESLDEFFGNEAVGGFLRLYFPDVFNEILSNLTDSYKPQKIYPSLYDQFFKEMKKDLL